MATVSRPNITDLLVRYMKQAKPEFKFTSIQVNKNYLSALHVDSNNMGPSFIVGFGNYIGGEGKYSKRREHASRNGSTVVDIFIPPPSFKHVPLISPRSSLSKIPKQVFFF